MHGCPWPIEFLVFNARTEWDNMLQAVAIRKTFFPGSPDEKKALDGVDLSLDEGDFCMVIGSNGAGKTCLLNVISGNLVPDSGRVLIGGTDVSMLPVHKRAAYISRVFQDPMAGTASTMSVAENLLLADLRGKAKRLRTGLTSRRRKEYGERLETLGLGLEDRLDTPVNLLSGGQRQSLSLIMAVSNSPHVLLLDEHVAALDPRTAQIVLQATVRTVEHYRLTTLMVTHNMQHAVDYGNRIIMMAAGKIKLTVQGKEKEKITVHDLISRFSTKDDRLLLRNQDG